MTFPPQGTGAVVGIEEATYNTWNHVWTRDYGAGISLSRLGVSDEGTTFATDMVGTTGHVRTLAGAETNLGTYFFENWSAPAPNDMSRTGRYQVGVNGAIPAYEIWRDGAMVWSRNPVLDLADFSGAYVVVISLSGEFLAMIAISTATGNQRYVMLYQGI